MKKNVIFILPFILIFTACTDTKNDIPNEVIDGIEVEEITRIVKTFSADSFLGRKPFTFLIILYNKILNTSLVVIIDSSSIL